jgi:hypothetical protein
MDDAEQCPWNVRFWHRADITMVLNHVRFQV